MRVRRRVQAEAEQVPQFVAAELVDLIKIISVMGKLVSLDHNPSEIKYYLLLVVDDVRQAFFAQLPLNYLFFNASRAQKSWICKCREIVL